MLKCTLSNPSGLTVVEEVEILVVRTVAGELGIMKDHEPVEARLADFSVVRIGSGGRKPEIRIRLGYSSFLRFFRNEAVIMSDEFTALEE